MGRLDEYRRRSKRGQKAAVPVPVGPHPRETLGKKGPPKPKAALKRKAAPKPKGK